VRRAVERPGVGGGELGGRVDGREGGPATSPCRAEPNHHIVMKLRYVMNDMLCYGKRLIRRKVRR
jgi:hypothetical protein